jgi:Ni,Fe-hydrogenase III component G
MTSPDDVAVASNAQDTGSLVPEEQLRGAICAQFPSLNNLVAIKRARRVWADVPMAEIHTVIAHAKDALGYDMLCTITGTDEGEELGLIYHLAHPNGIVFSLCTRAPKDGVGPATITPLFPLAELYEREVIDLLGARIEGLPPGNRYPLPDTWPEGQYPLRKDWKPASAPAQKEQQG